MNALYQDDLAPFWIFVWANTAPRLKFDLVEIKGGGEGLGGI